VSRAGTGPTSCGVGGRPRPPRTGFWEMRVDNALLRRMAYWGARYGPRPFAEHSPRLLGLGFALGLPEARRHVRENLRLALGERHRAAEGFDIARTFMNYAACLSEAMGAERP